MPSDHLGALVSPSFKSIWYCLNWLINLPVFFACALSPPILQPTDSDWLENSNFNFYLPPAQHPPPTTTENILLKVSWWHKASETQNKNTVNWISQQNYNSLSVQYSLYVSQRRDTLRTFTKIEMWMLRTKFIRMKRNSPVLELFCNRCSSLRNWERESFRTQKPWKTLRAVHFLHYISFPLCTIPPSPDFYCY